ncbi:LysR family transcriptional regulator [Mesobacterium sp. TK19101]|uniref:LysR family transcriptional regulator n=1 Tax=Mesobacterium hydrothermale TaxID=3111907 RepID=A0ABU6HLY8_9RHOB|nr:LysR family transcriptional regulator [Mesobacterium sp. TK19101]MEC3863326.1 LysR family transcriptional regulator [Mesobacterium sp. TK19101]
MDWKGLPPLSALRAFAAYAETGSVTRAGDALNVTHAAISQQIRNLEASMGLTLLNRSGRSLTLTPQGEVLAAALADGFGRIAQVTEALSGASQDRPLHVATTPSFAAFWLLPRLARFRDRHSAADIIVNPSPQLIDPSPGGVDLCLRYGGGEWPGLQSDLLLKSPVVAVAAPDLLPDNVPHTPDSLRVLPWLQEMGTNEASRWLERQGLTETRVASIVHLPGHLMIEAVRQGQGVAVTARKWVESDLNSGRLVELFRDPGSDGYHLVTLPGIQRPLVKDFIRWLRTEARDAP